MDTDTGSSESTVAYKNPPYRDVNGRFAKPEHVLEIRSSEWYRGQGAYESYLYNKYTKSYCCLGLDGRMCGVPVDAMNRVGSPAGLAFMVGEGEDTSKTLWPDYYMRWIVPELGEHTSIPVPENTRKAMSINDNPDTSDEEKIALLRPIFAGVDTHIVWLPNE